MKRKLMSKTVSLTDINKQLRIFETLRHLDAQMPVGQIEFFLNAAKMQPCTLTEIAQACDAKMTTASRYLANLAAVGQFKETGLNLLKAQENPMNRRQKLVELTPEGERLLETIVGKQSKGE
jgi:DNA-binding MarR family transcriptional regulator